MTRLPPILARDFIRHAIFPALQAASYLAALASFAVIGAVVVGVL